MKILLLPIWLLAVSFSGSCVMLGASFDGKEPVRGIVWGSFWAMAIIIPTFVLFREYDKERFRRMEIENRWKKSIKDSEKSF